MAARGCGLQLENDGATEAQKGPGWNIARTAGVSPSASSWAIMAGTRSAHSGWPAREECVVTEECPRHYIQCPCVVAAADARDTHASHLGSYAPLRGRRRI